MEKFILRNNPLFEITLNEDSFEINNTDYRFKNGIYRFNEFKSVELIDKKLDWISTFFGNIIGFFLGGQAGFEIAEARFKFHYHSGKKQLEVKLIDCDLDTANQLLKQIKTRIHSKFINLK